MPCGTLTAHTRQYIIKLIVCLLERRFPLKRQYFQIGLLSVIALVVVRLCIGWHFFYEGCWKIDNADKFSALPFLTMAKGPFAPIFYAMSPDLDGVTRLKTETREVTFWTPEKATIDVKKEEGKDVPELFAPVPEVTETTAEITVYPAYFNEAQKIYNYAIDKYAPEGDKLRALQIAWGTRSEEHTSQLQSPQ